MFKTKHRQYKIFFGLAVFCLVVITLYFWRPSIVSMVGSKQEQKSLSPEELLADVGKLVVLPIDEKPTIATVTDLAELQKQEFFRRAKIGDKVIIYAKAGKVILYSPIENKIVEMAPLNKNLVEP